VTIHTDGWIKLDTKQLDEITKFDSGARNFNSTRGVYLVTQHLRATQHRFHFDGLRSSLFSSLLFRNPFRTLTAR